MLLGSAVTCIVLLTTWGGTTYSWGSAPVVGLAVGAAFLVLCFCLGERRAAEPLMPLSLFKNGVFVTTSAIGFIVGFIMFGAIIYLPLYFQTVDGATPTTSGLELLPLVAGMLLTFIPSGRLVTRWGRYKIFPIVGTAFMTIGLYLLSMLTPTTPLALSSLYLVVVGLGIGLIMQVIVVAVQNGVSYGQLGTATSSAMFFRTIGGAFGVALFGSIFNSKLFAELPHYLPASVVRHYRGHNIAANPAQLNALPPAIHAGFVQAFSHSLDAVFLVGAPVALVAFVLSFLVKEVPLRERTLTDPERELAADLAI
jgi:MFS family permease